MAADAPEIAGALAGDGATVVLVATTADARARAGALASELERAGGRAAVFTGDVTTDEGRAALAEMLDELFAR